MKRSRNQMHVTAGMREAGIALAAQVTDRGVVVDSKTNHYVTMQCGTLGTMHVTTVVVRASYLGRDYEVVGNALCQPGDQFNRAYGRLLATTRALQQCMEMAARVDKAIARLNRERELVYSESGPTAGEGRIGMDAV